MYATLRRYEGIDKVRCDEVTRRVGERLAPPPPRTASQSRPSPRRSGAQDTPTHERPIGRPAQGGSHGSAAAW
jgi:hypothetical protein